MYHCMKSGIMNLVYAHCPTQQQRTHIQTDRNQNTTSYTSSNPLFMARPKTIQSQQKVQDQDTFAFFRTISSAGKDWAAVSGLTNDLFFQKDFLAAVEAAPPDGMRLGYLVFYKNQVPAGIAVCQIKHFAAAESLNELDNNPKEPCFFGGLAKWFKKGVANWAEADILICGNLLVTGAHGYWFNPSLFEKEEAVQLLRKGLQHAAAQLEQQGTKIAMMLIKDITLEDQSKIGQQFTCQQFTEFEIQPNMVLDLHYPDFDAYLNAMTTKYRTRAKRAFKKATAIEKRELTSAEIRHYQAQIYHLYKEVASNAGFNMVDLNEQYIPTLHERMQGQFQVFGYFLNGEMVSYYTILKNNEELEAHFLGYNKAFNHDYQLYLNMLYDIVDNAFRLGCHRVVFARTALEIKSSIGAVPEPLYCYLCHQNVIINRFAGTLLDYLKPVEEWQQRHPFKHSQPHDGESAEEVA